MRGSKKSTENYTADAEGDIVYNSREVHRRNDKSRWELEIPPHSAPPVDIRIIYG